MNRIDFLFRYANEMGIKEMTSYEAFQLQGDFIRTHTARVSKLIKPILKSRGYKGDRLNQLIALFSDKTNWWRNGEEWASQHSEYYSETMKIIKKTIKDAFGGTTPSTSCYSYNYFHGYMSNSYDAGKIRRRKQNGKFIYYV